jgi:arylsulfatase A-like enzyme
MMRWPKEIEPKTSKRMVTNVDIAATIYDAAGVKPPLRLDGRSLLSSDWSRRFVFLEHAQNPNLPTIPAWRSVRSKTDQYIEYLDTEGEVTFREYYDLEADPWQLENLLGNLNPLDDPDVSDEHDLVTRLSTCRGTSGRNPCP